MIRPALLALWIAAPAWAEGFAEAARGDLTGDGADEIVLLDGARLVILAPEAGRLHVAAQSEEAIWPGLPGEGPFAEILPNGSLRLRSGSLGIGRDKWEMAVTIAYRDGVFLVAGLTYTYHDSLDLARYLRCDVNLLTGGRDLETSGDVPAMAGSARLRVTDWDDGQVARLCGSF